MSDLPAGAPPGGGGRRPTRQQAVRRRVALGTAVVLVFGLAVGALRSASDGDGSPATSTTEQPQTAALDSGTTSVPSVPTAVADPEELTVLVNQVWRLPPGWEPPDLVEPDVPFTFSGSDPKRLLRAPAARALESLFAAADRAGNPLAAVSGYRSESKQGDLFGLNVSRHGEAEAERRSARPGHSEHQTGLAMDVTSADGACPIEDCFADTPASMWLADHAHEHGFVIRYPQGKEAITGYDYEPWHLRYVGVETAARLVADDLVLEELPTEPTP